MAPTLQYTVHAPMKTFGVSKPAHRGSNRTAGGEHELPARSSRPRRVVCTVVATEDAIIRRCASTQLTRCGAWPFELISPSRPLNPARNASALSRQMHHLSLTRSSQPRHVLLRYLPESSLLRNPPCTPRRRPRALAASEGCRVSTSKS